MAKTNQPPLGVIALLVYAALEASIVFIPLYAQDLGASYFEVGVVGLSYGMAYFLASFFFGWQSDKSGRVNLIKIGLGIGSVAFFLQVLANNLPYLMLVRAFCGFSLGVSSAAMIAYAFETEGVVGKFTSYGALGLVVGSAVAAIIKPIVETLSELLPEGLLVSSALAAIITEYNLLFTMSALMCFVAFILSLFLIEQPRVKKALIAHPGQVLMRDWKIFLPFFLRQIGARGIWIIMPLFLADLGASKSWIGILWMINFGAQFITMRFTERFKESKLFISGIILSGVVFLGYFAAANYLQVIPIQVLLGISWSAFYVGALVLLMRKGEERGTSSGILFSITSLCEGLGPFLGGALVQLIGFKFTMIYAAVMSFAGLPIAFRMKANKEASS